MKWSAQIVAMLMVVSGATSALARVDRSTVLALAAELGADEYGGRVAGTKSNLQARERLVGELASRGVKPAGTDGYLQRFSARTGDTPGATDAPCPRRASPSDPLGDCLEVVNVLGIFYPAGTEGQAPTVLLSAHYDGIEAPPAGVPRVGHSCHVLGSVRAEHAVSEACNGVADNLTGVAAIFGIIDAIGGQLTSPVAIALWDGEESHEVRNLLGGSFDEGLLGSTYFVDHPTFDVSALRLHINLESLGFVPFPGMERHLFVVGAHTGGAGPGGLEGDVRAALDRSPFGFDAQLGHWTLAQKRTDLDAFVRRGWSLPFAIFMNGPVGTYHTSADDFARVNWDSVIAVANVVADLTVSTAARSSGYEFQGDFSRLVWMGNVLHVVPRDQLQIAQAFVDRAIAAAERARACDTAKALKEAKERLNRFARRSAWWWGIDWMAFAIVVVPSGIFDVSIAHTTRALEGTSERCPPTQ